MDGRFRWAAMLTTILGAVIVGVVSYNAGVSHGLAISPALANAPVGPYVGYRPWGFGFGFGPFFLVLFWFLAFRMFFWGGFHRRRWHFGDDPGGPRTFEEWHRRAHERMDSQTS